MFVGGTSCFFVKYKFQIIATLIVNIMGFSHGNAIGWLAPVLPVLQSDNSPLSSGKITINETSWIGAIVCIGGVIGNFCFGMIVDRVGRKISLCLLSLPHVCFWFTVMFGTEVYHLYIGRILSGISGGGVFVILPIYIAEISDNSIRGMLGSTFILFLNAGILTGFVLGTHLTYELFPRVIITLPIFFLILMYFLPDTPYHLLRIKKDEEAEESLKFYRSYNGTTKEEIQEFSEHFNNLKDKIRNNTHKTGSTLKFKDFYEPVALKAICIGLVFMIVNQFSGMYALVSYTASIFEQSGSDINANTSTIVVGAIQLIGTCIATNLVDRLGRKILLFTSLVGVSLGLIAMGLFSLFSLQFDLSQFNWVPVTSLSFAILLGSIGIIPLPFVVLAELLPQKVRSTATTFCMCCLSLLAFIVLKIYPILMESIGLYGVMFSSSLFSIMGSIFVFICVPETKGKPLD